MNNKEYATHYEALPPYEQDFHIGFRSFEKLRTMRPHWHEHLEFVYITSGIGTFILNGERISVRERDLIVAAPNTLHALLSEFGIDYHCLLIRPSFFKGDDIDLLNFKKLVSQDSEVRKIFAELRTEFSTDEAAGDIMKKSLVYKLIAHLARNHINASVSKEAMEWNAAALSRMKKVENFVSENYKNKISTADLARMFFVSENHFCRLFKKTVGISALEYINEYRVCKAEILLKNTDLAISEISAAVGFENANYFSRVFRKIKKQSPTEYRGNKTL